MRAKIALMVFCLFASLTVVSCVTAWAQATAQISGNVADQSGAVLPGVEVKATQTDTGVSRTSITNETGSYVLSNLPLGPYRVEASLTGFRTFVQSGITLDVNSSPTVNVTLEVGQVSEQVEVQANANLVETRNVGVGNVIENQRILELPLNGRQVTDLITLAGGAVQTGTATQTGGIPGAVAISVAGGFTFGVNYMLDGVTHMNLFDNLNLPYPFPDAMQEFKVETNGLNAQNGMHSGANVNAVTKSGTNEIPGDLFEFVRNGDFKAPFVNNKLDLSLLSPAALKASTYLPQPIDQCGKTLFGGRQAPNEAQYVSRMDYQLGPSQSIFGRYIATEYFRYAPLHYTSNPLVSPTTGYDSLAQGITLGHTWLINPNMVNAFRFAGNRTGITRPQENYFDASDIGVKNFYDHFMPKGITRIVSVGFTIGGNSATQSTYGTSMFQVSDDLSFTRGAHQAAIGFNVTNLHSKINANVFGLGSFTFTGQFTGSGLGDLLAGKLNLLVQTAPNSSYSRQYYMGFYGQDTWKVTPRLTVNYGLRWEPFFPQQMINGHIYHIDYDALGKGVHSAQPQYKTGPD